MFAELTAEGWVAVIIAAGALFGTVLNHLLNYRREKKRIDREDEIERRASMATRNLANKIDLNNELTVATAATLADTMDKSGVAKVAIEGLQQTISDSRQPPSIVK